MATNIDPDKGPTAYNKGNIFAVDPNPPNDEVFTSEDLNISVELRTFRLRRSSISYNPEEETLNINNEGESSIDQNTSVRFIRGDQELGGITTHYTELRTEFEGDQQDLNTLGITNIDIEFNESYAPLITIDFVDVRGRLFEHGTNSPYNIFFDLPYPIFELTIKGFYGPPVTYCIHLTKFKSRFNADTGNFEIKTDFVGYTYAFLSDMLLGYVRAIGNTQCGSNKLKDKPLSFPISKQDKEGEDVGELAGTISIDELLTRINRVNEFITKAKNNDEDIQELALIKKTKKKLENIKGKLNNFVDNIIPNRVETTDGEDSDYSLNLVGTSGGVMFFKSVESGPGSSETFFSGIEKLINNVSTSYQTIVSELEQINKDLNNGQIQVELDGYEKLRSYSDLNYDRILTLINSDDEKKDINTEIVNKINDFSNDLPSPSNDFFASVIEVDGLLQRINDSIDLLNDRDGSKTKDVSLKIANKIDDDDVLGFKPTISNIIEIFSNNVEAFVECIKSTADAVDEDKRKRQLKSLLKGRNLDFFNPGTDPDENQDAENLNVLPFPEYRESNQSESGVYEEKYIGEAISQDIPETKLVDDLLNGILESRKTSNNVRSETRSKQEAWFPVSPIDVKGLNEGYTTNRWETVSNSDSVEKIIRLFGLRALTFLDSVSNEVDTSEVDATVFLPFYGDNWEYDTGSDYVDSNAKFMPIKEVKAIGRLEARNAFNNIENESHKETIASINYEGDGINTDTDDIDNVLFNGSDSIDNGEFNSLFNLYVRGNKGTHILYYYDSSDTDSSFFNEIIDLDEGDEDYDELLYNPVFRIPLEDYGDYASSDRLHLTSHKGSKLNTTNLDRDVKLGAKPDLGETHISIMTYSEYRSSTKSNYNPPNYINTILNEEKISINDKFISYEDIKNDNLVTNPKYRFMNLITGSEFFKYTDSESNSPLDLSLLFYETIVNDLNVRFPVTTVPRDNFTLDSINFNEVSSVDSYADFGKIGPQNELLLTLRKPSEVEGDFGIGDVRQSIPSHDVNSESATIPYFGINTSEFRPVKETNDDLIASLHNIFGTYFYNRQESEEARAFLFLNTIPFRGINDNGGGLFRGNIDKTIYTDDENDIILNLFKSRSSFLKIPYPWILYLGSILWRSNYVDDNGNEVDPIKLTEGIYNTNSDTEIASLIVPKSNVRNGSGKNFYEVAGFESTDKERKNSYLYFNSSSWIPSWSYSIINDSYQNAVIEPLILNLPDSVKNTLINEFTSWVNQSSTIDGLGWRYIKDKLELFDSPVDTDNFIEFWKTLYNSAKNTTDYSNIESVLQDFDIKGSGGNKPRILKKDVVDNVYGKFIMSDIKSFANEQRLGNVLSSAPDGFNFDESNLNQSVESIKNDITEEANGNFVRNGVPFNFFVEMQDNTEIVNELYRDFLKKDRVFANFNRRIWKNDDYSTAPTLEMSFIRNISNNIDGGNGSKDFGEDYSEARSIPYVVHPKQYIEFKKSFIKEFKGLKGEEDEQKLKEADKLKQQIFGSMDNEDIKLTIYKNVKNIYDKWIGGSNTVLDTCGTNFTEDGQFSIQRESEDVDGKDDRVSLIDSFLFLDRSYRDISDDFIINPVNIMSYMSNNFNKSFYNFLARILSDNNMEFIPLPSFIDFSDKEQLKEVFTPKSFNDSINLGNRGPTFICMYIGERSSSLDLGKDSNFEDDGLDVFVENGDLVVNPETPDFGKDDEDDTNPRNKKIPLFLVNYGDRNQSIFKDFSLDQSEFTETNETLIVQDRIAKRGSPTNEDLGGQNLFNIYNKRAYHCEIEAMGTAYIQPMMYFQLNNVPMFHGVYNIIKVNHSIQPHNMSTTFTGVRIGNVATKMVNKETIFMNLVSSLSDIDIPQSVSISTTPNEIQDKTLNELNENESLSQETEDGNKVFGDPVDADIEISSEVKIRGGDLHEGIDIETKVGTPAIAIEDGKIERIKVDESGFGLYVLISHEVNSETYMAAYAHLTEVDPDNVIDLNNLNDSQKKSLGSSGLDDLNINIKRGQKIGETGGQSGDQLTLQLSNGETKTYNKTGSSTGPHLHFELRKAQNLSKSESGFFNDSNILDPKQMIASTREDPSHSSNQSKQDTT